MSLRIKALAVAAAAVLASSAGVAATWTTAAQASTSGCAFTNGCATLNGADAASHAVAMDAKHKSARTGTLIIGYPNIPGDGATNFDAVLHFTTSATPVYADTSLLVQQPTNNAFVHRYSLGCIEPNENRILNQLGITGAPAEGHVLTWSLTDATDGDVAIDPVTGQITDPGVADGNSVAHVTVKDGYGDVANAVVNILDTGTLGIVVASGNCTSVERFPAEQSGGIQFDDVDSSFTNPPPVIGPEPVTWAASGLPGGVSLDPATGFLAPGTAAPGSYGVKVTATDTSGAASTITFTLNVIASTSHVLNHTPFWTFVYAKNGVWSSECVTDVNGSGALQLAPCTLGRDRYQDWFALDAAGTPSQALAGGAQFHIQNWLAHIVDGANSCLTDPSILPPGTPQSDATDQAGPPAPGRQLRADGSCTSVPDLWRWAT